MSETSTGQVLAVQQVDLGSALDGDHLAGATVLLIEDCADFDEVDGGPCYIDGTSYTYSAVDDDASTITITPALAADTEDGTTVQLADPLTGAAMTDWIASVTLDGEDPGDTLEATVRSSLVDRLAGGIRGITGERVVLEWDGDSETDQGDSDETGELWLIDILGMPGDGRGGITKFHNTDIFTATAGQDLVEDLTYLPTNTPDGTSVHVYWRGIAQVPGVDFTLSGQTLTVLDPGFKTGDAVWAEYAYDLTGQPPPPATEVPSVVGSTSLTHADFPALDATVPEVALPAGTQEGDLLILALGAAASVGCSDARFDAGYFPLTGRAIFRGIADGSGAPIPVTCTGAGVRPEAAAVLLVIRGYPLDSTSEATGSIVAGGATPAMPPAGSFGIVAMVGGDDASSLQPETSGNWTRQVFAYDRSKSLAIATANGLPPGTWAGCSDYGWRIFGLQ